MVIKKIIFIMGISLLVSSFNIKVYANEKAQSEIVNNVSNYNNLTNQLENLKYIKEKSQKKQLKELLFNSDNFDINKNKKINIEFNTIKYFNSILINTNLKLETSNIEKSIEEFIILYNQNKIEVKKEKKEIQEKTNEQSNIKIQKEEKKTEDKPIVETTEEIVKEEPYSGQINNIGGISDKRMKLFDKYYLSIPENVRNSFINNGWEINATTEHLGQKFYNQNYSIMAITLFDAKAIFVSNRDNVAPAIVHEFGHYIDYMCGYVTNSEEFADIYNDEVNTFCALHKTHKNNTNTAMEYFAEFYQVAILNPSLVKDKCPRSYEFVMRYSNSI